MQVEKSSVDRVVGSGYETGRVGTEKKSERRDLARPGHSAHGLQLGEFLQHVLLAPRIVLFHEAIDKRGMDPGRRNAIAANVLSHIVARH